MREREMLSVGLVKETGSESKELIVRWSLGAKAANE